MKVSGSSRAVGDIEDCLLWSATNFGAAAALRYRKLLAVVIGEIVEDPELQGSKAWPGLQEGVRLYHLAHGRKRAAVDGLIVKRPRHFIVYRVVHGDAVEIVRVLDDRMDLEGQMENET